MQDADARLLRNVRKQHRLEEFLIAAMRVLGSRPRRVWTGCGSCATRAARRNEYAGQLDAGDARRREDVMGIVCGQPEAAKLVGPPKPPENLHGAGADLAAFHVRRIVGRAALGDDNIDASPSQIYSQRQPDRATADNQHPDPHITNPARWCSSAITARSGQLTQI